MLTNVSVYWFTRTGASAARFMYEAVNSGLDWVAPSSVPQGQAAFGSQPLLRRVADPHNSMAHWSDFERGGHFPAMEAPDLLVQDLRDFFRRYR